MRSAFLAATLVAVAFAGCTGDDPTAPETKTPAPGVPNPAPPGSGPAPHHGPVEPVADAGEVAGAFSESWTLHVPPSGVDGLTVHFNLTGAQAGLPPTARLFVVLRDPAGGLMGQATLGLGGDGDAVHWRYGPSSVAQAGDYVLEATAADTGLPSGGLARYEVYLGAE